MDRIMGLDLGDRRVGVAVSDLLGLTAQGVTVIDRKNTAGDDWLLSLDPLVQEYEVSALVIGLPRNMDGTLGKRGIACQAVSEILAERYHLPVHLWDERLSTTAVERTLVSADVSRQKRKKVIDKLAASWILQGYLDAQRRIN